MSCFFRHAWGKWEEEIRQMHYVHLGTVLEGQERVQRRVCQACGLIEERDIKKYY
jgi:hypothetical protein